MLVGFFTQRTSLPVTYYSWLVVTRMSSFFFLNNEFPINIFCSILRKEEVKSEAMKLLYANLPKTIETVNSSDESSMEVDPSTEEASIVKWLPDFVEMVLCISQRASSRMKSRNAVTYGTRTLPFDIVAYSEVQ